MVVLILYRYATMLSLHAVVTDNFHEQMAQVADVPMHQGLNLGCTN